MSYLLGKVFDDKMTKLYQSVLNSVLKKKYDWFDHIVVDRLSYSKLNNYMGLDCVIYADEDWVGEQWRKFYYSKPIPLPSGDEEEPIMLNEIISNDFSKELQETFKLLFDIVTGYGEPKYISWSWTLVKPVEIVKKNLKETITKVLREEIYSTAILKEEKHHLPIKRRLHLIDKEILRLLHTVYNPDKICIYRSGEELVMVITEAVVEYLYHTIFYNLDDESEEWKHIFDFIVGYIQKKYGKKLEEYFHLNCEN